MRRALIAVGIVFAFVFGLPVIAQSRSEASGAVPGTAAANLEIDRSCEHTTTVTVENAWPGARPHRYALYDRSTPAPDSEPFAAVVAVPVRRIVSLSSTAIPHIRDLGMIGRIVAVDTGDYIYDEELHRRIAAGQVVEVGSNESLDVERIIATRPDVVVASAIGPDDPTIERLQAASIPVIVLADWRENDPIGRMEWIRLFGALFGRADGAERIVVERTRRYHALAAEVAAVPAEERPAVMVNAPWQGSWPVPAGDSYVARLLSDAGAHYLWADQVGTGSVFLDLEAVMQRAATAEVWVNLNFGWRTKRDVVDADPRLSAFAPYRTGAMYHYIGRVRPWGANDYWESGAARPDIVLADLIRIFHPHLLPDRKLVYYRRID